VNRATLLATAFAALVPAAAAQSLTAGTLRVTVSDAGGTPLREAYVIATELATGVGRAATTSRAGVVKLDLVPPGVYLVSVERLGYRPVRVTGVTVRPGRETPLSATLAPVPRPALTADTVTLDRGAALDTRAGESAGLGDLELHALPDASRDIADAARRATALTPEGALQGLPAASGSLMIDGVRFTPAAHQSPFVPGDPAAIVPLLAAARAELVTDALDVEWTESAAGWLAVHTRRGTNSFAARAFGDWSGDALSDSKYFDTSASTGSALRAGALVSGPVLRDSAAFVLGGEIQRVDAPRPPAWEDRSLDAPLVATAQDSFGVDLAPYTRAGVSRRQALAVFGGFDWQVATAHRLDARAAVAARSSDDPALGAGFAPSLGARSESRDVAIGLTATSVFTPSVAQEVRFGFESSQRDYQPGALPATTLVDAGLAFGSDGAFPGEFKRVTVRGSGTAFLTAGRHLVKAGLGVAFDSHERTYSPARGGSFTFAGVDEWAARDGRFEQTVGRFPVADFSIFRFALYAQDTWSAAPGLDVLVGVRYENEELPADALRRNQAWLDSTGVDNTAFQDASRRFSPRIGFTWDVRNAHQWTVRLNAGTFYDAYDPGTFGELIVNDGGQLARRAVGPLGRWPAAPDSTVAPAARQSLTLFGPRFSPPRTRRASLGITRALGSAAAAHVAFTIRHTDFLPRRHDLNRLPAPAGRDQYGRPLYGTLAQQGSLVTATPGSNRAYRGFDLVSAIDADGASDYWDVTFGMERRAGPLQFAASYTYSRTTDNWLTGRAGGGAPAAQLTPFPDSLAGQDWAEGRSDFDVPHRVAVGAEWQSGGRLGLRLGAAYRFASGLPFTPGFRPGVDVNGDGADNDPAFVDDAIAGVDSLLGAWDCLRDQVGQFAERNACREPGRHALDLRVALRLPTPATLPLELVIDALNVIEPDVGLRDRALYLIDRGATVTTDPVTGITTVPLVANPRFGSVLARYGTGRAWRIGLRVNY
jgi:hypothetical protein